MNRFKKWLAMLLSIIMVMGSMPVEALADQTVVETKDVGQPAAVALSKHTVTFDPNEGNGECPSPVEVEKRITLPSGDRLTRENAKFMGWGIYKDSGLTKHNDHRVFYLAGSEVAIEKDTTFYAVWATSADANYFIRLDGQIPVEPANPPTTEYTTGLSGSVKYNTFYANASGVNEHLNTIPQTKDIRELCNKKAGSISFANST